jgi:fatty-acyl-CoA synthase
MTEFGGSVAMVDPADDNDARLGHPGPAVPRPGDRHQGRLPVGKRGEIVIRGPSRFGWYHNDPAIDADGWYHSGDLGTVGEDGRLRYLGRLKDMLKVGGENVAAIEIASHLQAHPAVAVAHVTGVADEKDGEVAAAFIELSPGAALTRRRSSRTAGPGWPASRSRGTCGSSPSGRCPPPRCRRSGCASSSKPSWPPG